MTDEPKEEAPHRSILVETSNDAQIQMMRSSKVALARMKAEAEKAEAEKAEVVKSKAAASQSDQKND